MNRVFLRTDKGEYYPGDYVCGVVYLEIQTPTEARGIQLSFKGTESACCELEQTGLRTSLHTGRTDSVKSHQVSHDYVDYCRTELYRQSGTFEASGNQPDKVWSVVVKYLLVGHVISAEDLVVEQEVVVRSVTPELLRDSRLTKAECMEFPPTIPIFGRRITVTVKILENVMKTGECIHLRMVITNKSPSQTCTFSVKLVRILSLTIPIRTREEWRGEDDFEGQKQLVTVVDGQHTVVREMTGTLSANSTKSFSSGCGFDNLMVPLKTQDGRNLAPSIEGKFVRCNYCLQVSMHFGDQQKAKTVTCDIARVLPADNTQWFQWRPLPWMRSAEVKLGRSPISPPEHLLEGESFSSLPPFQEL